MISVVSPVYKAGGIIPALVERTEAALSATGHTYEIILVNDSSPDESWSEIRKCCAQNPNVKGISLSRNFGQHQAIEAGLSTASGQYVVVMDCDLQDRPEEIPHLLAKALEGYDIVQASRTDRKDGLLKKLSSKIYHKCFAIITGHDSPESVASFGIYSRQVIDELLKMPELDKQLVAQVEYLGFRKTTIPVSHGARQEGKSSYTIAKLTRLAISSMTTNSNRPLLWAAKMGLLMSALSFALAIYNIVAKISGIITVPGYTTTVFSIWFVGGLILMMLGITGLYIGNIFNQVKGRQPYIIMEKINF